MGAGPWRHAVMQTLSPFARTGPQPEPTSLIDKSHDVVGQTAGGVTSLGDNDVRTHWQNDTHCAVGIYLTSIAKVHSNNGSAARAALLDAHHRPAALANVDGAVCALDLAGEHVRQGTGHGQH